MSQTKVSLHSQKNRVPNCTFPYCWGATLILPAFNIKDGTIPLSLFRYTKFDSFFFFKNYKVWIKKEKQKTDAQVKNT